MVVSAPAHRDTKARGLGQPSDCAWPWTPVAAASKHSEINARDAGVCLSTEDGTNAAFTKLTMSAWLPGYHHPFCHNETFLTRNTADASSATLETAQHI